jgi:hypothetical protein
MGRGRFGSPDMPDFSGHNPVVWGSPAAPVVWGQPAAPIQWGSQQPAFGQDYAIMGAYEIMGDVTASPAQKALAMQTLANGGQVVGQTQPRRTYSQTLPCTSLDFDPGDSREISLQPQRPFRPEKFRASSTHTAPFFTITAYSIGQDNQFVGPGSIPVDLFSEVALYSQIEAYTANLGNLITLTVENIDTENRDFRAAFFGTSLGN